MDLVTHPNPILRRRATPVVRVTKREERLLQRMFMRMKCWNGIGLAAPQVGCLEQLIVAEVNSHQIRWINPEILESNGSDCMTEGCLSVPGVSVAVRRPLQIWTRALTSDGTKVEQKLDGLAARVVQHEIDHLKGILIIDHGAPIPYKSEKTVNPR